MKPKKIIKTDEEWEKLLTPEQFNILRKKGTESPGTGKWLYNNKKGFYYCVACGNKLFSSEDKFNSGTGWPSFTQAATDESIKSKDYFSLKDGYEEEVICARCEGHHGHVFNDGPTKEEHPHGTGKRFCVNGNVLKFREEK